MGKAINDIGNIESKKESNDNIEVLGGHGMR